MTLRVQAVLESARNSIDLALVKTHAGNTNMAAYTPQEWQQQCGEKVQQLITMQCWNEQTASMRAAPGFLHIDI